jgi:hypothetical protein
MPAFEYDHLDIKELATVEREYKDARGFTRVERYIDRKRLQMLMRKRREESRRVMEPFRHWLILARSYTPDKADKRAHTVFIALWETRNKPIEKLAREDISVPARENLRGALNHFCEWLLSTSTDEADKRWARDLMVDLARLKAISMRPTRAKKNSRSEDDVQPFTREEWSTIFENLEAWHKRYGGRWPWARPLLRIQLIAGLRGGDDALLTLERKALVELVDSKKQDRVLVLWSRDKKSVMIPFDFIADELLTLLRLPFAWGIVADIICSEREELADRMRIARQRFARAAKHFREDRTELASTLGAKHWPFRCRLTAMKEVWSKTHDMLLLSSMFALPLTRLRKLAFLDDEGRQRIEEMAAGNWIR